MSYTTTQPPGPGQTHQVVVELNGPVDKATFDNFTKALKALADQYGAGIGARGSVTADTRTLLKHP